MSRCFYGYINDSLHVSMCLHVCIRSNKLKGYQTVSLSTWFNLKGYQTASLKLLQTMPSSVIMQHDFSSFARVVCVLYVLHAHVVCFLVFVFVFVAYDGRTHMLKQCQPMFAVCDCLTQCMLAHIMFMLNVCDTMSKFRRCSLVHVVPMLTVCDTTSMFTVSEPSMTRRCTHVLAMTMFTV